MALDRRLASLRIAVLEDWAALETDENNGELVVRVKKSYKMIRMGEAIRANENKKQGRQEMLPAT